MLPWAARLCRHHPDPGRCRCYCHRHCQHEVRLPAAPPASSWAPPVDRWLGTWRQRARKQTSSDSDTQVMYTGSLDDGVGVGRRQKGGVNHGNSWADSNRVAAQGNLRAVNLFGPSPWSIPLAHLLGLPLWHISAAASAFLHVVPPQAKSKPTMAPSVHHSRLPPFPQALRLPLHASFPLFPLYPLPSQPRYHALPRIKMQSS